jgi:membrane protease YdiL (CAAX protease family)
VSGDWAVICSFGRVDELPGLGWLAGWALHTLSFGLGEETGWRGFALPRFQGKNTASMATLKLGLLWAGWHIPLFAYKYSEMNLFGIIGFLIGMLSGAVIFTWLYNSTGGSILAVIFWHW